MNDLGDRWTRAIEDELPADDFAHYCGGGTRGLMLFVGLGDTARVPSLHDDRFLPRDQAVVQVAHALVAGYLAAVDAQPR